MAAGSVECIFFFPAWPLPETGGGGNESKVRCAVKKWRGICDNNKKNTIACRRSSQPQTALVLMLIVPCYPKTACGVTTHPSKQQSGSTQQYTGDWHETARKGDSAVGAWCCGTQSEDRSATPAPTPASIQLLLRFPHRNRQTHHHSLVVVVPYSSEHRRRYYRCRRYPHSRLHLYLRRCTCCRLRCCCRWWRPNIGEVECGGGSGGNGRRWSGVSAMSSRSLLFLREVGLGAGIFSRALVNPGGQGDMVHGSRFVVHDSMVRGSGSCSWFAV